MTEEFTAEQLREIFLSVAKLTQSVSCHQIWVLHGKQKCRLKDVVDRAEDMARKNPRDVTFHYWTDSKPWITILA